ncbi:MAG: zinc ribbon domain-containing protein, partial [Dehalococcoidia bacterium]
MTYLPDGLPAPAPYPDGLAAEFWDATKRHELLVQRCNTCRGWQWGPEYLCYHCHSFDLGYERVSGRGRIYSWERSWYPVHPALKDATPYLVVLVELPDADNVRMVGNLLGDPMQSVPIGG